MGTFLYFCTTMKVLLLLFLVAAAYAAPTQLIDEEEDVLEKQDLGPGFWGGDMAGIYTEQDSIDVMSAILDKRRLWPGGQIPYQVSRTFPPNEYQMIKNAIAQFNSRAQCLQVVPRTNQRNYVQVVKENGCWSFVGNLGRGSQKLSLGRGCLITGTIQHEFLHAAGFIHEHQRTDRDNYVTIDFNNVRRDMASNFQKQRSDFLNTGYDYGSVMHYGRTAFSFNGRPTIIPKDRNARIGNRSGPSATDLERIKVVLQEINFKFSMCPMIC